MKFRSLFRWKTKNLGLLPSFRFLRIGVGDPLILLPSPVIRASVYEGLALRLAEHFHVLVPELPGSGTNPSDHHVWRVQDHAHWLIEFMDRCEIPEAIVVGHSNSGAVALAAAALFPDRVRALVLADTIGQPRSFWRTLLSRAWDGVLEMGFTLRAAPALMANLVSHPRNLFHQIRLPFSLNLEHAITRLEAPTLVVWGKKDHTAPVDGAYRIKRLHSDTQLYFCKTGSHDWVLTHSEEFVEAMIRWVKDRRVSGLAAVPEALHLAR